MPQSLSKLALTDVQAASFTPQGFSRSVDFNAQLIDWSDTRKPRVAYHEYLKRDGGEAEYMGRAPHQVRMNLVYVGPNWRRDFFVLQAAIDASPIGTLVHPFFGSMQVVCDGVDGGAVNIADALDTVTIPISFRESNLNQKLTASQQQGPASKQSLVSTYSANLTKATQIYLTAAAAVTAFNTVVNSYTAAAVASTLSTGAPDPTLPQQLANVGVTAAAARAAIRLDPNASSDVATFTAIESIEQLTDLCNQLADSVTNLTVTLTPYTVPAQASLLAIAQQYYGKDAASRMAEILANNIGAIPNAAAIASGTVLLLAAPTVVSLQ